MTDLAVLTAILYAARLQRRIPESDFEKRGTIAAALNDARLILAAVTEAEAATQSGLPVSEDIAARPSLTVAAEPEQPPPSPGTIGRIAGVKAARRRG